MPGVLKAYDPGDVACSVAPRPLMLLNPVDEVERPAAPDAVASEYRIAEAVYGALGVPEAVAVLRTGTEAETLDRIVAWIGEG